MQKKIWRFIQKFRLLTFVYYYVIYSIQRFTFVSYFCQNQTGYDVHATRFFLSLFFSLLWFTCQNCCSGLTIRSCGRKSSAFHFARNNHVKETFVSIKLCLHTISYLLPAAAHYALFVHHLGGGTCDLIRKYSSIFPAIVGVFVFLRNSH